MNKLVTAFALCVIVARPALAVADTFTSGDRVQATAAFFMCGARDDLATINALDRQGDKQTALKLGTERCQSAKPGETYIVLEIVGDAICIRHQGAPFCLWAPSSALRAMPTR